MFGKRTYPKASVTLKPPNRPELSTGNKIRTNTNQTLRERERKKGKEINLERKTHLFFFFWGFFFCPKTTVLREQRRKKQSLSGQQTNKLE